ncbi:putative dehydrogenase [Methanocalculus alkaliphilus]|uniref:Gfo/Idh/MocA family protein n=1 Tax=Methanocalculus alkaliphilus TaxID=768730 RepID=UPI00344B2282|nr:putative dehydrogenase [Methanocalculus alkaliphilus]
MMDVGVIGTGIMGRNHVRVYSELKEVGATYVYDLNTKSAEEIAALTEAEVCPSMEALLRKVDLVTLAVPTPFHFDTAMKVMKAGVHALIEKPICLTAAEGEALIQGISEDLIVGVGHIERFNPIVAELKKISRNPEYIAFHRHNPASARVSGSSVIEDLMIHDIDILFNAFFPDQEYTFSAQGNGDIALVLGSFGKKSPFISPLPGSLQRRSGQSTLRRRI